MPSPKKRKEGNISQLILSSQYYPDTKPHKNSTRKLQGSNSDEHKHKNPQHSQVNLDLSLTHIYKNNSKWIMDLNIKCKPVKLLGEIFGI